MQSKQIIIGSGKGEYFDDSQLSKINAIKIQYNKQCIVGIAIQYDKDQKIHNLCESSFSKMYYNVWEEEFIIKEDDYLQCVNGYFDVDYINSLQFNTYQGFQSPLYGRKDGNYFELQSYGDTFSSCHGSYNKYGLTSIGFKLQPLNYSIYEAINNVKASLAFGIYYPQKYVPQYTQFLNYPLE